MLNGLYGLWLKYTEANGQLLIFHKMKQKILMTTSSCGKSETEAQAKQEEMTVSSWTTEGLTIICFALISQWHN